MVAKLLELYANCIAITKYFCCMWKKLFFKILVSSIAVMVSANILPGVHIDNYSDAIVLAVVLSILNAFVKPVLLLLTIPLTIFTFGLFLLAINAIIILLAANLVDGFDVDGFWSALFFSVVLSLLTSILDYMGKSLEDKGENEK